MEISLIKNNFNEAKQILDHFIKNEENLMKIACAGTLMLNAFAKNGKVLSCGNGGSMCDAIHFAEELSGKFRENRNPLPAIAIADIGHISCVANDFGYDHIFSRYVQAIGNKNDVLLAISTSGNSENIIKAAEIAKEKGMKIVGLTGKNGGKLASLCDVEIRVSHNGYADRIQEIHIKIIHSLIHFIESKM